MKRKILIKQIFTSVLGMVLLFASTGIHLSIHTCIMAKINPAIECDTCSSEDIFNTSNCENETDENVVKISSQIDPCCTFRHIDKKVDDKYLTIKTEEKLISSIKLFYPHISILPPDTKILSIKFLRIKPSPQYLLDTDKYITNSVLLI